MGQAVENSADAKRERILEGAMKVFLAYGFARTTMDDIARAAEVSRPTLYQQFRNKADIFRAIGTSLLETSLADAELAVRAAGAFDERLMAGLDRGLFQLADMVQQSPHGDELIDVENKIAADIVAEWRERLVSLVDDAVTREARRIGSVLEKRDLSSRALAEMLLDTLEGMRLRGICGAPARDSAQRFIILIEIALETGRRH